MRTTITIDDDLFETMRARAREQGLTVSAFVRAAIRAMLARTEAAPARPFHLVTYGSGGPAEQVDLDRTSALLVNEDESTYGPR